MNAGGCSPQKNQKKNQKKPSQFTNFGVATGFFGFFWFFWDDIPTLKSNAKKPKKPKKNQCQFGNFKKPKKAKKQKSQCQFADFGVATGFFLVFLGEHPPNAFDVSILQENVINCLNFPKIFRGSAPRLH